MTNPSEELDLASLSTYPPEYPFARQIEDILEQFDDYRAALLFEAAEIQWPTDEGLAYPTRGRIRGVAKRLLVEQAMRRDGYVQGSGFLVLKMHDRLGLYFTPHHGETFAEGYPEDEPREGERVGYFDVEDAEGGAS
jgi:hypothetical protein